MLVTDVARGPGSRLLNRLGDLCADRGLGGLSGRLLELGGLIGPDLGSLERSLGDTAWTDTVVGASARRLLELGGKRLRPICVMLAAKVGSGFDDAGLDLAVAAELTHNATLLHDDVVDHADSRRGAPSARFLFGNAASIFAGDWLLVEALKRVRRAAVPGTLEHLLDTIEEMIHAEALQLENRGRLDAGAELYFRVAEGKSASLFRWALDAGARAGGLGEEHCRALAAYGTQLGVAFQMIDDLLDLTGDVAATGKALFTDLREGKMTYPLIVAAERTPELKKALERIAEVGADGDPDEAAFATVVDALHSSGAAAFSREVASGYCARAVEELAPLPDGVATRALRTVAEAVIDRRS